ncbi:putative phosphomevalonate kinase [Rosellinia necatrix]|uniref:Phosphomevalonate kinase n=1 Tax=Rosellinia necatrix TaxID=77044 RepID=A0A1W2TXH3_ROSNE|nr:putative phosphomevalonate kinase [Rosellinia necatrix]
MPDKAPTAISAPGKVFLAGGYLVLDREYTALVFGLSARINVVAREIKTSPGVQLSEIVVDSPQFLEAQWRYGYHLAPEDGGIKVTQLHSGEKVDSNPFVEVTLCYALSYIANTAFRSSPQTFDPAQFTILADNDYYSQPHSMTGTDKNPTRFAKFPTTLKGANKTGLGSSAALVTALTAALLTYYMPQADFDITTTEGKRILHNLAQAAHCAAQGKVGSGFDIAAAVYGSCLYRRFSPSVLKAIPEANAPTFGPALTKLINGSSWDVEVVKEGVSVPPGTVLRMCDVDCGSQTVGMVKKVLAWRAANPDVSKTLCDELQSRNVKLGSILSEGKLDEIRPAVAGIRELLRSLGTQSDVPIEPESQTALLDALMGIEGVYNGVVPGAGGYDAVALLMKDDEATEKRVKDFVANWSKEKGGQVRLLGVKGEMEGARREDMKEYDGWV